MRNKKPTKQAWTIKADLHVALQYQNGRCYGLRFAPNMTEEAIAESLRRDPPMANEWRGYDESTNSFVN